MKPTFEKIPDEPLNQIVDDAISHIQEIRTMKFDFEHPEFDERLAAVLKQLNLFNMQLEIISAVINNHQVPNYTNRLHEFNIDIQSKEDICENITAHFVDFVTKIFFLPAKPLLKEVQKKGVTKDALNQLLIWAPKIFAGVRFLPMAVKFDKEDLFALREDHPRWQNLSKYADRIEIRPDEEIQKSYQRFLGIVYAGNASCTLSENFNGAITKNIVRYLSAGYYLLAKQKAKEKTELFYANPNQSAFKAWSTLDTKFMLPLYEKTLTSIAYNQVFHFPKIYPEISLDLVRDLVKDGIWGNSQKKIEMDWHKCKRQEGKYFTLDSISKEGNSNSTVQVRLNSPLPLDFSTTKAHISSKSRFGKLKDFVFGPNNNNQKFDTVIIHMHGGGWVSMSSGTHQIYFRHWAKMLNAPVFSIDYVLAPKSKYPGQLNDVWQAYNFIIDNMEDTFGFTPKNILLAGDSAGGNLALALTLLCLKSGVRPPTGLLLGYPALNLDTKNYSPSYLKAVNDEVVPFSFLEMCRDAYLPDPTLGSHDPLVSPFVASENLLKQLPPIRLMVGDADPIHDDCWKFLDKMVGYGHDIRLTVFKHMMHGMWSFDMPRGMPECFDVVKDAAAKMNEMIEIREREVEKIQQ